MGNIPVNYPSGIAIAAIAEHDYELLVGTPVNEALTSAWAVAVSGAQWVNHIAKRLEVESTFEMNISAPVGFPLDKTASYAQMFALEAAKGTMSIPSFEEGDLQLALYLMLEVASAYLKRYAELANITFEECIDLFRTVYVTVLADLYSD